MSLEKFKEGLKNDLLLLDARKEEDFLNGFIPGSVFCPVEKADVFSRTFLKGNPPFLMITNEPDSGGILDKLKIAGIDNFQGTLKGGFTEWSNEEPIDILIAVDATELAMDIRFDPKLLVIDLRDPALFRDSHVSGAVSVPLSELADVAQIASLENEGAIYFYGADDSDALVAASLLKKHGMHNVRVVYGGWQAIEKERSVEKGSEKPSVEKNN